MVTALPTPPSSARPATFNADMDTFLAALPLLQAEINSALAALGSLNLVPAANKIINGGMVLDQRNAGASVTPTASSYVLDRWCALVALTSKFSVQQISAGPAGFSKAMRITSLSAYAVGVSERFSIAQFIEGYNCADLNFGAAGAKITSFSFWVRSSLTGQFGGSLQNSAANRSYPFSYTINAANTWEQKSVTLAGDTIGTWLITNGVGLTIQLNIGSGANNLGVSGAWAAANYTGATGSTSLIATNGATLDFTGVKLEISSVFTPYVEDDYSTLLRKCQRYYTRLDGPTYFGYINGTSVIGGMIALPSPMRVAPTLTFTGNATVYAFSGAAIILDSVYATQITSGANPNQIGVHLSASSGTSSGAFMVNYQSSPTCSYKFDAEL